MPIVNRTEDASEQRKVYTVSSGLTGTGATGIIATVPYPSLLDAAQVAGFGFSLAPTASVVINRFIANAGFTAITVIAAQTYPAYGTSGVLAAGLSLPASGSTLLNLLANDVLMYQTGGSTAAVTGLSVSVVIRPIQDIKKHFGLTV